MIPEKTIKELINKHSILEKDLSSGTIDKKIFAEKSKEYSDLNEIVEDAKRYITYEKDKIELEKILQDQNTDQELINMAQTELINLKTLYEKNEKKLKLFLLPKDEADKKNAIIEIRAGTGGLEASLFAADLFKMYEKISHKNKAKGMKILRARLYELERSRIDQERSQDRKSKIGTGDRSERIRTYNFPQGRVTDHRINLTLHKLEEFLEGEAFDEMIESLTLQAQEESLSNLS